MRHTLQKKKKMKHIKMDIINYKIIIITIIINNK